jgi:hypothetical protein
MYDMEKLKPIALDDLIRLGSRHDGGYVLPRRAIAAMDILRRVCKRRRGVSDAQLPTGVSQ